MTLGFVMLAHGRLSRAAQVAECLAAQGASVVMHVDGRTTPDALRKLCEALQTTTVQILPGRACRGGHWSMVQATMRAGRALLEANPRVTHLCLISGDAVPLAPVRDMQDYLAARPDTDLIESVSLELADWVGDGLGRERLVLYHPVCWRANRRLFDLSVDLQRKLGMKRRAPKGMRLYLGSQWWCLTRRTFGQIESASRQRAIRRFFRRSWIPDESFFQSLVRQFARRIESRSPMLAEFDAAGRVRMIYDDHVGALEASDKFFARKVWHGANRVYERFAQAGALPAANHVPRQTPPQRQSRQRRPSSLFVSAGAVSASAGREYWVFHGLDCVFEGFDRWARKELGLYMHGRLFSPDRANFCCERDLLAGGVSADPAPRDAAPRAFLRNVLRASADSVSGFSIHPSDKQGVASMLASDSAARLVVVPGAWVLQQRWAADKAPDVARFSVLQRREAALQKALAPARDAGRLIEFGLSEVLLEPVRILAELKQEIPLSQDVQLPEFTRFDLAEKLRELTDMRDLGLNPSALPEIENATQKVDYAINALRQRAG